MIRIPVHSRALRRGLPALVLAACALAATSSLALAAVGDRSVDGVWRELGKDAVPSSALVEKFDTADTYRLLQLDDFALFRTLRNAPMEFTSAARTSPVVLSLPLPEGGFGRFSVAESPILSPQLAAEEPQTKTYIIQGLDEPTWSGRAIRTEYGFNALIVTPDDFIFVERATDATGPTYLSFRKSALPDITGFSCSVEPEKGPVLEQQLLAPPSGANLRTYNLALVCTGEYQNFYGSDAAASARMTALINAVNALYEREVAIRLNIVCRSFYNNAATDPFTNPQNVDGTLLNQADATLDADCPGGYQIGHLLHRRTGAGDSFSGRAAISSVCQGDAGRAASTGTMPNSGLWIVDLLPHEMGHQFSAQHTYNSTAGGCVERQGGDAYEIGGGSTIMSYACAGCTGEDSNGGACADAYFHTHSFDQITNYREGGGNCGAQTATGNTAPGVNAGSDYTIPRGTAFILTASGSDPDGDALTWCWEQFDLGAASPPLGGTGPLFRSFLPVNSTSRTFPNYPDYLAGNPTPFEILPTTDRTLTFRATARDNRAGGGGVNYDTAVLTVSGDPFVVNSPNGGENFAAGCKTTVTWTVGGGSVASNVNILMSTDGGLTFPTSLESNVANDGSQQVTLPCVTTNQCRIRVQPTDNVFFDQSDGNFSVAMVAPVANLKGPSEAVVDGTCTAVINVNGDVTDDCAIDAALVTFTATDESGAADIVVNITPVQDGDAHVTFSGTVTVSDLTVCPATIRITVNGVDRCSQPASDFIDVTVTDETPPQIAVELNRTSLWPPNHKLVDITADVDVTDNCAGTTFVLTSITSNEPENGTGDGDTAPDVVGATYGTADTEFQLRSERMGGGNGRTYTILYTATDNCGNATPAEVEVRVEHDQSGHAIVTQVGQSFGGDYLAVVVPGSAAVASEGDLSAPVDRSGSAARRIEPASSLEAGNTAGVLEATQMIRADIDADGLPDAIALFALAKAEALRSGSDEIDGPVGLHYRNVYGEGFLVSDLLAVPRTDLTTPIGEAILEAIGEIDGGLAAGTPAPLAEASGPAASIDGAVPSVTRLAGLRPNPFLRQTAAAFDLARPASVRLEVYSLSGARVRGLAERTFDAGRHAVTWDGRDDAGRRLPPGMYFIRFIADGVTQTGKALLLP